MNKKYERYINYIVNDIELPYIKSIEQYGLKQDEMGLVLSKVYDQPVTIKGNVIYNTNGKIIYSEDSTGYWYKKEYDNQGNRIYYEDSTGYWYKKEYDTDGNLIYHEDSSGDWYKYKYNTNGKLIYFENSDGDWYKYKYDTNGNEIYYEDSDGEIIDRR